MKFDCPIIKIIGHGIGLASALVSKNHSSEWGSHH